MKRLFTERHGEDKPRVSEVLDETTRNGLLTFVSARVEEEWFGLSFPNKCGDGYAYAGTDFGRLRQTMEGLRRALGRETPTARILLPMEQCLT